MEMRDGQAFILGSVIFTSLFLIAVLPSGPQVESGSSGNIQDFFLKSFDQQKQMFNHEMKENQSADHLKRKIYVYNQFIQQSAGLKGGSYSAYHFFLLPEKGEAVFINFQDRETDVSVHDGSWNNSTIKSYQFRKYSIEADGNVTLEVSNPDHSYELRSFKPMLAFWMKMTRQSQSVEDRYTG